MRRVAMTLLTAFLLTAGRGRAASLLVTEPEPRRNMLLVNPGDLFSGIISLECERGLASWFGITLGSRSSPSAACSTPTTSPSTPSPRSWAFVFTSSARRRAGCGLGRT